MGNFGCREDRVLDTVQKNPRTSVLRISLRTSIGIDMGLGNFASWWLLSRHFKRVQNILQGDRASRIQFCGWLQPRLQLCLTVCSWMELIVCVMALKAQGISPLETSELTWITKWFSFQIFGRYIVCSARKLPTWTVFKSCLLQGFSKKWSRTLFRGCTFCDKNTNVVMIGLSVICALLRYYTA